MHLERVINSESNEFKEAYEIYKVSFPIFEQRTLDCQIKVLTEDEYNFEVIKNDANEVLGLLFTWKTKDFVYVEHFAILGSVRGQNIGTKILKSLIESIDKPIILEIDPPIDDVSVRRKVFYEHLRFEMSEYNHQHPPYRKNKKSHNLKIMSNPKIGDDLYVKFNEYLHNTVMRYSE